MAITNWRSQLSFLDHPVQSDQDRIIDHELTVRLLLAILYQANASDSDKRQPWQDRNHADQRNLYGDISDALDKLGAYEVHSDMSYSGTHDFGAIYLLPDEPCELCGWRSPHGDRPHKCFGPVRDGAVSPSSWRYRVVYTSNKKTGERAPCERTFTCFARDDDEAHAKAQRYAHNQSYTFRDSFTAERSER